MLWKRPEFSDDQMGFIMRGSKQEDSQGLSVVWLAA